jgi:hypothetical protein
MANFDTDRYPTLGKRISVQSMEDVFTLVQAVWPRANSEGSVGMERSFIINNTVIAHSWSPKGKYWGLRFYVRIAFEMSTT